jgi:surface antigen
VNLFLLLRSMRSMRKEACIVGVVLLFVLAMPLVTLLAVTNLGALADAIIPTNSGNETNISLYDGPNFPGDYYAFGNCTYWVFIRRAQIGEPIPANWGNASAWADNARLAGHVVDHNPSFGAIMQISDVDHGLGHVAFVENVEPDGTWHISEMNVVGFDEMDDKAMPASAASDYNFIH